ATAVLDGLPRALLGAASLDLDLGRRITGLAHRVADPLVLADQVGLVRAREAFRHVAGRLEAEQFPALDRRVAVLAVVVAHVADALAAAREQLPVPYEECPLLLEHVAAIRRHVRPREHAQPQQRGHQQARDQYPKRTGSSVR